MHRQAEIDLVHQKMDELTAMSDKELLEYAWVELNALCGANQNPPKKWTMTIPVDAMRDSDIIFGEILIRFKIMNEEKPSPEEG